MDARHRAKGHAVAKIKIQQKSIPTSIFVYFVVGSSSYQLPFKYKHQLIRST